MVVDKLNFTCKRHSSPYNLSWLKKGNEKKVQQDVLFLSQSVKKKIHDHVRVMSCLWMCLIHDSAGHESMPKKFHMRDSRILLVSDNVEVVLGTNQEGFPTKMNIYEQYIPCLCAEKILMQVI